MTYTSPRTVVDGQFCSGRDDLETNDARVTDVVVLVTTLVVARSLADDVGTRQQRRLTIGVVVAVELEYDAASVTG